jgi:peptide methionine sulfoxide reductase MsrA
LRVFFTVHDPTQLTGRATTSANRIAARFSPDSDEQACTAQQIIQEIENEKLYPAKS